MTHRFGPTRGEYQFRLGFSSAGLAFVVGALIWHEGAMGLATSEVFILATAFLGGSAVHSAWRLRKDRE